VVGNHGAAPHIDAAFVVEGTSNSSAEFDGAQARSKGSSERAFDKPF
jgi:hypothetical protein